MVSSTVPGNRITNSWSTGLLLMKLLPRSPCASCVRYVTYWPGRGTSRPRRWRSARTSSGWARCLSVAGADEVRDVGLGARYRFRVYEGHGGHVLGDHVLSLLPQWLRGIFGRRGFS